jgi:hypothetical protein
LRERQPVEKRPDHDPERRRDRRDPDEFFGLDVESMSPRSQLATGLAVIVPIALAGIFLFAFTEVWWIWFTFFWLAFPAFGFLVRGIAGLSEDRSGLPSGASNKERELLEALRDHGELTPAQAAMETSLSVSEADEMLKELTEKGHIQVRVRGGGLFYSLWEVESGAETGQLEGR